jgi:hypothetical protein
MPQVPPAPSPLTLCHPVSFSRPAPSSHYPRPSFKSRKGAELRIRKIRDWAPWVAGELGLCSGCLHRTGPLEPAIPRTTGAIAAAHPAGRGDKPRCRQYAPPPAAAPPKRRAALARPFRRARALVPPRSRAARGSVRLSPRVRRTATEPSAPRSLPPAAAKLPSVRP